MVVGRSPVDMDSVLVSVVAICRGGAGAEAGGVTRTLKQSGGSELGSSDCYTCTDHCTKVGQYCSIVWLVVSTH